jgi:hypothetical protein
MSVKVKFHTQIMVSVSRLQTYIHVDDIYTTMIFNNKTVLFIEFHQAVVLFV